MEQSAKPSVPWRHVVRALAELAFARLRHVRMPIAAIHKLNRTVARHGRSPAVATDSDTALIEQVAHVIPRVADRVPWRSDCLPQAMAAQRWLIRRGIATSIVIGVERSQGGDFLSHAWLQYGDRIVTGGDVAKFSVVLETPAAGTT